ncbi:hypothetical protein [Streptomyces erythrochromogenes]|uniref:hypothetical protein n=1 Tax=Streptomyces erythrochromogenes TaxID=285574 RepID=UPI00386DAB3D|nr:hypothetical protein OG364_15780 [Streptomyces erythrochromogenes]
MTLAWQQLRDLRTQEFHLELARARAFRGAGATQGALDDAAAHGYTVHADGSVQYPQGGENVLTKEPVLPGGSVQGVDKPPYLQGAPGSGGRRGHR